MPLREWTEKSLEYDPTKVKATKQVVTLRKRGDERTIGIRNDSGARIIVCCDVPDGLQEKVVVEPAFAFVNDEETAELQLTRIGDFRDDNLAVCYGRVRDDELTWTLRWLP